MGITQGASGARYSPQDFIVPGSDHQGHSERVYCRIQPLHKRQIEVIIASHTWPFRVDGDLMRWCIYTGLKRLESMEPTLVAKGFMRQADAILRMLQHHEYQQQYHTMFKKLSEIVGIDMSLGQQGEAMKLVSDMKSMLEQIESEPNWRARALKELDERFGYILNQHGVPLRSLIDDSPDEPVTPATPGPTLVFPHAGGDNPDE